LILLFAIIQDLQCWSKSSGLHQNSQIARGSHKHNSGAANARELFKCSKVSSSLVVCYEKTIFGLGIFCEWCHTWRAFRLPWPTSPGPGPKLLVQWFPTRVPFAILRGATRKDVFW